tara:strand:+ start:206 stop:760 length:555 start_codon:yes stop_codon:yes gene_type:complete
MSETKVEVQDVKQEPTNVASEQKQPIEQVPYARFKELVDEKNTMKQDLESLQNKIKSENEARQLKEMESKGEYDKIMAEMTSRLEVSEKKSRAWDEYQANRRDSLLSKLPEDDRAVYDGLPLDKLEVHVDKYTSKPSQVSVDNSQPTNNGGYSNLAEWASLDPEGYKKANKNQTSGNIKIAYGE